MNLSAAIDNNILKFSYPRHHNTNSESAAPSYRPRGPMQSIPRAVHAHSASTGSATSDITIGTPDVANPSGHTRSGSASVSMSKMFSSNPFKHVRNHSNQCLATMSPQDVIARILAQDEIPRGTFLASEREKDLAKNGGCAGGLARRYPERLDSRRALLSMANGAKAPIVLRGPSPTRGSPCNARKGQTTNCQFEAAVPLAPVPPVPSAGTYAQKQLPPTPPLSILSGVELSPSSALIAMYACTLSPMQDDACKLPSVPEKKSTIPPTKPLNLGLARPTITTTVTATASSETKRFSRILQTAVPAKVVKRRTNVPAPIRPPHFRGPRAFNAPLSATSSESSEDESSFLALDFPLPPQTRQDKAVSASKEPLTDKVVVVTAPEPTPMGDLSITPLDIPVDWDDLHDRWTSPVINLHQDAMLADLLSETMDLPRTDPTSVVLVDSDQEDSDVLLAFQDDVASLFARSPTVDVRTLDQDEEDIMDRHLEPSAMPIPCEPEEAEEVEEGDPCEPVGREKRHGRVLVTKEIKLCLDVDIAQTIEQEEQRRRRRKSEVYVAGESFLMMASPLSPESSYGSSSRTSYLW
ncbi:SubName: Full=Uncharacterized protein {ECO:0000313/EMBL:CCA70181.1} [Serendipita indica DSM 11827]|uniref:Uncharacterized protein n=1 Tax=Serendipita indica (strain DSM 11827) TaxID=1109443 RepID=G4TFT0_SERID|nr:SubName: Full=Uncharacterized protein {ECO:0000313/EMBL:CCA70181.1} [Serendipita indica DSM 11827]CCA70181.1 hypothetical protein PIIN_04120 [Serendipita indica DSM 11827]